MRILILGAGGTGGYFGARLARAGADVSFLVRPRRAAQLAANGLVVKSPHGDFALPVRTVQKDGLRPEYAAVLFTCKAWDLDAAMEDIGPALSASTVIVPLLNGLRHIAALDARFGRARVLGGLCHIAATLSPAGEVVQLTELHSMTIGAREPGQAAAVGELAQVLGRGGFAFRVAEDIGREMWEKFSFLASLAAMTCLMRGAIGDIMATRDGARLMRECFGACVATAAAAGAPLPEAWREKTLGFLTLAGSPMTASMLRDMEARGRTEADHILGDMLERAEAAGVDAPLLRAAYCHLQTYANRLRRES